MHISESGSCINDLLSDIEDSVVFKFFGDEHEHRSLFVPIVEFRVAEDSIFRQFFIPVLSHSM